MKDYLVICDHTGEGYAPVWDYQNWRMAMIRDCEAMHRENIDTVSKHMETDETFTLLEGQAWLYLCGGNDRPSAFSRYALELGKTYVVRAGTWHSTVTAPGCKILIVENVDTGDANTVKYKIPLGSLPE